MTEQEIQKLISKLDTGSDRVAHQAIEALLKVGKPAVPHLMKAAKNKLLELSQRDDRKAVRLAATRALSHLAPTKS